MLKGTDKQFKDELLKKLDGNTKITKASKFETPEFIIKHYAGDVKYNVEGFVEKNKDTVPDLFNESLA
jgi:myosin-5